MTHKYGLNGKMKLNNENENYYLIRKEDNILEKYDYNDNLIWNNYTLDHMSSELYFNKDKNVLVLIQYDNDEEFYELDTETGDIINIIEISNGFHIKWLQISHKKKKYFLLQDNGIITCYDYENNNHLWVFQDKNISLIENGLYGLYVSCSDGKVICLSHETGEILWNCDFCQYFEFKSLYARYEDIGDELVCAVHNSGHTTVIYGHNGQVKYFVTNNDDSRDKTKYMCF